MVFHMHHRSWPHLVRAGVVYKAAAPSHRLSPGFPVPVPPELLALMAVGPKALVKKIIKAHLCQLFTKYVLGIGILDASPGFV